MLPLYSLRDLLEGCWAPNPAMRPTFAEILQSMDTVIEECKEAECRQKIYEAAGGDVVASVWRLSLSLSLSLSLLSL